MIDQGELDERIELFVMTTTDDGWETVEGWASQGETWARYMPGTVREIFDNAGREGEMPAVFKVRRYSLTESINETWKLVHRGVTYDVKGAVRDDRDGIRITATGSDEPLVT